MKKKTIKQSPRLGGGVKNGKVFDKERIRLELLGIRVVKPRNSAG